MDGLARGECFYIPVKEMLSNGPGFRSLYSQREIHFEEIYADILDRAYRPPLRGPTGKARKALLAKLRKAIDGKVVTANEEFFLKNVQGDLEFTLLAEGIRKLGLLWTLIQNGTLMEGFVLYHSLYRDPDSGGMIRCRNADRYLAIHPNSIAQAYADIYDREVQRTLGGGRKTAQADSGGHERGFGFCGAKPLARRRFQPFVYRLE